MHCVALRDPPQCLSGGEDGTVRLWGEWDPQMAPNGPKVALNGPKVALNGPNWP